jgi:hypothetical protein
MLLSERIITQLPLTILWTDQKELKAKRLRYVDRKRIRELMKEIPIVFVVADVGSKLKWINPDKCYQFWKEEVQDRLAENPDKVHLDDFPNGYAYIASEWTRENKEPIILLEKAH